jgi:hypothetical protein
LLCLLLGVAFVSIFLLGVAFTEVLVLFFGVPVFFVVVRARFRGGEEEEA